MGESPFGIICLKIEISFGVPIVSAALIYCLSLIEINYILDQSNNLLSLLLKSYKEIYNIDIDVSKNNLLCRIK